MVPMQSLNKIKSVILDKISRFKIDPLCVNAWLLCNARIRSQNTTTYKQRRPIWGSPVA